MMRTALRTRADAGRDVQQRDLLAECEAILLRADAAGRSVTLHERATIRQHVAAFEVSCGRPLLDEAECIAAVARQTGEALGDADRERLRLVLDVLDVIGG